MRHYGDITKISGYDVPIVDCVVGGSPCQDLSVAGKRAGLDGERSGLFMEQIRITKEMRDKDERVNGRTGEHIRPRFLIWENVPGAFSSNKAEDFKVVLEEIAKVIDKDAVIPMPPKNKWTTSGAIVGDGWSIAWRILDAQFWGVPQRRRRISLVADFGGQCAKEILFERRSLSGDSTESREKRQDSTEDAQGCIGIHDRDGEKRTNTITFEPGIASREGGHIYENVSGTLRSNMGDNQMSVAYSINHQGGNVEQIIEEKTGTLTASMNSSGNNKLSVAYGFDQGATRDVGVLFLEEQSKPLTNGSCPGHHNGVVICYDIGDRRSVANESVDVSPTLLSKMGTGGNNVPVVIEGLDVYNQALTGDKAKTLNAISSDADHIPCIVMDRASYNQGENALYNIGVDEKGVAFSHIAKGPGAVCYVVDQRGEKSGANVTEGITPTLTCTHGGEPVICYKQPKYIVRRLTPLECERLQGYPDGWTDIGEYIDSKGKKKKSSDSARYKALGNSIALPQWKWIIKRLCSHYERDATLCSLFDGIGGFPLIWEQINGKGSCLWASEIEDFPIAVTKTRIG